MSPGNHLTTSSNKDFFTINNFNYLFGEWCAHEHMCLQKASGSIGSGAGVSTRLGSWTRAEHSSPEPIRTSLITVPNQNWESNQPDPIDRDCLHTQISYLYPSSFCKAHMGRVRMDLGVSGPFICFTDAVTLNKFLCSPLLISLNAYREEVTKPNLLGLLEKGFCYQNSVTDVILHF